MSIVMLKDGSFGAMVDAKEGEFVPMTCRDYDSDVNGCTYHFWDISEDGTILLDVNSSESISLYCLLLLLLEPSGLPKAYSKTVWTVITSDWLEIKKDKSFGPPAFEFGDVCK